LKPYYPVFLDLSGQLCIVVGGGKVAERKIRGLLKTRARVRVISPKTTLTISGFGKRGKIEVLDREYEPGDLDGATLAFAATDSEEVNRRVKKEAAARGILINVADNPDLCDFFVPAVVRKDPILIALSTSGLLPGLSKRLRQEVTGCITEDYAAYTRRVGGFRKRLLEEIEDKKTRRRIMEAVTAADVAEVARMTTGEMEKRFLPVKVGDQKPAGGKVPARRAGPTREAIPLRGNNRIKKH
jgi:precorrin-2 dehydrogenase / sirohydrochlorin ferrochelatase